MEGEREVNEIRGLAFKYSAKQQQIQSFCQGPIAERTAAP